MSTPTDRDQVEFLTNVQRLLSEGGYVASYKFALLLALAEIVVERGDDSGDVLRVPLDVIAEHVIRLYWRQAAPHPAGHVLQQNTGSQAAIVNLVCAARDRHSSLSRLVRDSRAWRALRREVATVVKQMPLFKLQTLGTEKLEFLYANALDGDGIALRPGVTFCLRRFHALIEHLVQGAWVAFVRRLPANRDILGEATDLAAFLFGSERGDVSRIAPVLLDLQQGQCFYCDTRIGAKEIALDHFIPWSRYPIDLGHNFVLADAQCNSAKSDLLAAPAHLARWHNRNLEYGVALVERFDEHGMLHDLAASDRITSWAYASAERANAQVWSAKRELVPLGADWRTVLGSCFA